MPFSKRMLWTIFNRVRSSKKMTSLIIEMKQLSSTGEGIRMAAKELAALKTKVMMALIRLSSYQEREVPFRMTV
jgi:hypothetical protein